MISSLHQVLTRSLVKQTVSRFEKDNMWIGPREEDLIHVGAKYSPCMRKVCVSEYSCSTHRWENLWIGPRKEGLIHLAVRIRTHVEYSQVCEYVAGLQTENQHLGTKCWPWSISKGKNQILRNQITPHTNLHSGWFSTNQHLPHIMHMPLCSVDPKTNASLSHHVTSGDRGTFAFSPGREHADPARRLRRADPTHGLLRA